MSLSFPANSQDSKDQKQRANTQSRYGVGGADDLPKEVLQRDLGRGQFFFVLLLSMLRLVKQSVKVQD